MAPSTKKIPLVDRQKAKGKHSLEVRGRWFCQTFSSLLECNIQLTAQVQLHSMNTQLKRETPSASQRWLETECSRETLSHQPCESKGELYTECGHTNSPHRPPGALLPGVEDD